MKKINLIITSLFIIFFSAYGQKNTKFSMDPISSSYYFSQEVSIPGIKEIVMFTNAQKWFTNNLQPEGLQMWNDNRTGKLIGKGQFELSGNNVVDSENSINNFVFTYTITLFIKDNKYKYIITNYKYSLIVDNTVVIIGDYLANTTCPVCNARAWNNMKNQVHTITQNKVTSLIESLIKPLEPELSVN